MKSPDRSRPYISATHESAGEEKHLWDYVRVVYKRRWIALPAFLLVFGTMTFNSMRQVPTYRSQAQLLIEKDAPTVARLDQMFQSQEGWYNDEFYQTQYRILQSRSLAKRTIDAMKLWDAPKLGNGPEAKSRVNPTGMLWGAIALVRRPFTGPEAPAAAPVAEKVSAEEDAVQSGRISEFLGGLRIVPVRNTRLVEIGYTSTDPKFAAEAANALAAAYIQQNMEFKLNTSKEAGDF
ncbi:MAG: hypothetical protein ABIP65_09895, partial [Vicinamibacterales bacterium]